jgi:hypothetical protein
MRREADQAQDPAVWLRSMNGKLSEILVERDQYPALLEGHAQECSITRIDGELRAPDELVPARAQVIPRAPRRAGIEEQLHQAAVPGSGGSMRSCATIRRA